MPVTNDAINIILSSINPTIPLVNFFNLKKLLIFLIQ